MPSCSCLKKHEFDKNIYVNLNGVNKDFNVNHLINVVSRIISQTRNRLKKFLYRYNISLKILLFCENNYKLLPMISILHVYHRSSDHGELILNIFALLILFLKKHFVSKKFNNLVIILPNSFLYHKS